MQQIVVSHSVAHDRHRKRKIPLRVSMFVLKLVVLRLWLQNLAQDCFFTAAAALETTLAAALQNICYRRSILLLLQGTTTDTYLARLLLGCILSECEYQNYKAPLVRCKMGTWQPCRATCVYDVSMLTQGKQLRCSLFGCEMLVA